MIRSSQAMFPPMTKVVPPGQLGSLYVDHFEVDDVASRWTAMQGGREFVPPGRYARLVKGHHTLMSDTPYERRTNARFVRHATGTVLIAGYGLGMVLTAILPKPDVQRVVVVELDPDVITLVAPHIQKWTKRHYRKLVVLLGDIHQSRPAVEEFAPFDAMWFDIWAGCSTDELLTMTALTRKYRHLRRSRDSFMDCWDRDWLRYMRRRERC